MKRRSPKSLSTVSRGGNQPRHEAFMAITILEMERHRRQREAEQCRARLTDLESRIREIDHEVATRLSQIEGGDGLARGRHGTPYGRLAQVLSRLAERGSKARNARR